MGEAASHLYSSPGRPAHALLGHPMAPTMGDMSTVSLPNIEPFSWLLVNIRWALSEAKPIQLPHCPQAFSPLPES